MNNECLNEPEMYKAYIEILLAEMLIFINRCIPESSSDEAYDTDPKYKKVYDIIDYIKEHYMDDISLPALAKSFYISVSGLTKAFKQVTGFSFTEYLNNIRIKNAYKLLDESKYTISDIAHKVGYNSITHYGRVFKESTGYTPSQYRNTNRFLYNAASNEAQI
jgi:YesN/AraC family two-component response regulator